MSSTALGLERYAEMRAELEAGWLRDEVLARAGLTAEEWVGAQRTWLEKMGAELDRGRFELTNQYTKAFLGRQRTLKLAAAAPSTAAAPSVAKDAAKVAPSPPAPSAVTPTALPAMTLPAPVMPPLIASPPLAPPSIAPPVGIPPVAPPVALSPAAPPPGLLSSPVYEAPTPTLAVGTFDALQTMAPHLSAADREALPFTKGPPRTEAPSTPFLPASAPAFGSSLLEGTLPLDALTSVRRAALPFEPTPKPENTAPLIQAARATAAAHGPSSAEEFDAASTLPLPPRAPSPARAPVTPFEQVVPPPRGSEPGSRSAPVAPPVPGRAPSSPDLSANVPPQATKAVHGISLAQYAEICAAVTTYPERVVEIRGHYGLDAHAWMTLHALWQDRFLRDPTLEPRWEALVQAALARRAR